MDAYDIQQRIKSLWETVATPTSGDTLNKVFPQTPVYVLVDDKLIAVDDVYIDDRKIIIVAGNGK